MTIEELLAICEKATEHANEPIDENDGPICHSCGDIFYCGDLDTTEACNLCAQEYREQLNPTFMKELLRSYKGMYDILQKASFVASPTCPPAFNVYGLGQELLEALAAARKVLDEG